MNLFYIEHASGSLNVSDEFILEGQEAIHAHKVLRIQPGDPVMATDGKGSAYKGETVSASGKILRAVVKEKISHPRPGPEIAIAIGNIKKRDRLEFAVEKAVELGVLKVFIFHAGNSEKKNVRLDRLKTAALGAMKQSMRCWRPDIFELDDLESVLDMKNQFKIFVADEKADFESIKFNGMWKSENPLFIVGPEGGFTSFERELIARQECKSISLGKYRLRTETAVIAVAALSGIFSNS
jgi:16S rRNA (uracil1498-N3)-methyltransferase